MPDKALPEPWLRGTNADAPSVHRAVLHALELASEDLQRWCGQLNDEQLNQRPAQSAWSCAMPSTVKIADGSSLSAWQAEPVEAMTRGHFSRTLRPEALGNRTLSVFGNRRVG